MNGKKLRKFLIQRKKIEMITCTLHVVGLLNGSGNEILNNPYLTKTSHNTIPAFFSLQKLGSDFRVENALNYESAKVRGIFPPGINFLGIRSQTLSKEK